jgi:hypothetical protein
MVLDFSNASNQQLFTILAEDCPINYKYQAAFELQRRREKAESQKVSRFKGLAAYSGKEYRIHS